MTSLEGLGICHRGFFLIAHTQKFTIEKPILVKVLKYEMTAISFNKVAQFLKSQRVKVTPFGSPGVNVNLYVCRQQQICNFYQFITINHHVIINRLHVIANLTPSIQKLIADGLHLFAFFSPSSHTKGPSTRIQHFCLCHTLQPLLFPV